jgi:nucleoside 2-deoxyribosyltransferase
MSTIYLAASFTRRDEIAEYAQQLRDLGFAVTSRWLTDENKPFFQGEMLVEVARTCAQHDVEDVLASDTVIAFTDDPKQPRGGGGRHVELGIALATHKRIAIVGPREHVFHCLPEVALFDSFPACLAWLVKPRP